jgi:hypothetical protein
VLCSQSCAGTSSFETRVSNAYYVKACAGSTLRPSTDEWAVALLGHLALARRVGYTPGMKSIGSWVTVGCAALGLACAGAGSGQDPEDARAHAAAAIEQANANPDKHGASPSPPTSPVCSEAPRQDSAQAEAGKAKVSDSLPTEASPAVAPDSPASESGETSERAADSPKSHRGRVKELFALMDMQRVIDASRDEMLAAQIKANPMLGQFKDIMSDFLTEHMSWKNLERGFIDDYVETFSQTEIEDMIRFYKTPTGAKAISKMPELLKRGAQRGVEKVQKHMPELQKRVQERLKS